jgi:hypothetical protein
MRIAPPSYVMSELVYVKTLGLKKKELPLAKTSSASHGTLIFSIVRIIAFSLLVTVGFAYMGYISGHYLHSHAPCKDDVLSKERMGAYESVDGIMTALKSCD